VCWCLLVIDDCCIETSNCIRVQQSGSSIYIFSQCRDPLCLKPPLHFSISSFSSENWNQQLAGGGFLLDRSAIDRICEFILGALVPGWIVHASLSPSILFANHHLIYHRSGAVQSVSLQSKFRQVYTRLIIIPRSVQYASYCFKLFCCSRSISIHIRCMVNPRFIAYMQPIFIYRCMV